MIQVANTKHPVLHYVQQHDYKLFYKNKIEGRQQFFYPPFSRFILITFKHKIKEVADAASKYFAAGLKKDFGKWLLGPAEPVVNRVRNQYLMELSIKLPKETRLMNQCRQLIHEQVAYMHNDKRFRSVVIITDVDAM